MAFSNGLVIVINTKAVRFTEVGEDVAHGGESVMKSMMRIAAHTSDTRGGTLHRCARAAASAQA